MSKMIVQTCGFCGTQIRVGGATGDETALLGMFRVAAEAHLRDSHRAIEQRVHKDMPYPDTAPWHQEEAKFWTERVALELAKDKVLVPVADSSAAECPWCDWCAAITDPQPRRAKELVDRVLQSHKAAAHPAEWAHEASAGGH